MREFRHDFVNHERAAATPVRLFADFRAHSCDRQINSMRKSGKLVTRVGGLLRELKPSAKDPSLLQFDEVPMRQTLKDR